MIKDVVAKVTELGLSEKVVFTGVRTDISNLYSAMDVYILPSKWEGFPVTLVEAQANGLPCVVSSAITPSVKMIPPITQVSLNSTTREWTDSIMSYKNYKRIPMHEKIIAKGYDVASVAEQLEKIYLR